MKKLVLSLLGLLLVAVAVAQTSISSEDKKRALDHLKNTQNELSKLISGLSEEQVNYKVDASSWSIAECLEHIAISEKNLIGMVQMGLQEEANPSKRSEVKLSDEQLLGIITSREQKVKTRKEFEPTDSFGGYKQTLKVFKERRKSNMKFLKTSELNFRHYYIQFPFGLIDAYQGMLFISGHTQRHTDQIKEIMESTSFPG